MGEKGAKQVEQPARRLLREAGVSITARTYSDEVTEYSLESKGSPAAHELAGLAEYVLFMARRTMLRAQEGAVQGAAEPSEPSS